jgi:hypothetical protein
LATSAVILLPSVARADEGNWLLFGIYVFVIPTYVAFGAACVAIWILCPARVQPLAIALGAVPCTPIDNGTFHWPLWSYFLDNNLPGTMFDVIWRTILTAAAVYGVVWLVVWLQERARKTWLKS